MNQRAIEYTNTVSDGVAFVDYCARHSAVVWQQWWLGAIAGVVVILLLLGSDASNAERIVCVPLVLVVYWLGYSRYARWNAGRLYREGSIKGTSGRQRLTLSERGLLSESDIGQSVIHYHALEKVVETSGHVFIFASAFNAFVVPKTGVVDGDLGVFVRDLRGRLRHASSTDASPQQTSGAELE